MLRLCGTPVSSYYNKVKLALLEKDIGFKEEYCPPSQAEEYLRLSPMGKVPYLQLDDYGDTLTESTVILEYLEMAYPRKPKLYPDSVVASANCRELIAYLDNYVLTVGQGLLGMFLFGEPKQEDKIEQVLAQVAQGIRAVGRRARFDHFIVGGQFTAADVAAVPAMQFTHRLFSWAQRENPFIQLKGYQEYWSMIKSRPHVERVLSEQKAAVKEMLANQS